MIPVLVEAAKNTKNAVFDTVLIPISHQLLAIYCMKITEKNLKIKFKYYFQKLINIQIENTLSPCKSRVI
tara:strand:- start:669 stop:878 length:210 start_codon:yes stop_codon:yes gene_type:complete